MMLRVNWTARRVEIGWSAFASFVPTICTYSAADSRRARTDGLHFELHRGDARAQSRRGVRRRVQSAQDRELIRARQVRERGDDDDEAEAIGERDVERFGAGVFRGVTRCRPPTAAGSSRPSGGAACSSATPWTTFSWTIGNSLFCSSGRQRETSSNSTDSASQIVAGVCR